MPYPGSQSMRKQLTGNQLRELRRAAGLTIDQVAERFSMTDSRIRRQESGHIYVSMPDLELYFGLYDVKDEAVMARLRALVKDARKRGWWDALSEKLSTPFSDLLEIENMATNIATSHPNLVPGLLQSESYMATLFGRVSATFPRDLVAQEVEIRKTRQAVLHRPSPPRILAIIGEAAFIREESERHVIQGQAAHLLRLMESRSVSVQIMPLTFISIRGMTSPMTIFGLDSTFEGGCVVADDPIGLKFHDSRESIAKAVEIFGELRSEAFSMERSKEFLERLAGN